MAKRDDIQRVRRDMEAAGFKTWQVRQERCSCVALLYYMAKRINPEDPWQAYKSSLDVCSRYVPWIRERTVERERVRKGSCNRLQPRDHNVITTDDTATTP